MVATVVIVALAFALPLDRPALRCAGAMLTVLVAGNFMLPLAYAGEVIQGLATAPPIYVPLALLAVTLLPLLDRGRVKWPRWVAVAAVVVGLAWSHWATLYSESLPQHVNFIYVVDADAQGCRRLAAGRD